ncbi:hypothetical protein KEM56_007881 [Ascosphaera pollenicola]|nr:hypothetical protein KEM56_007881 [Ascosphaera pollenicola]
MRDWNANLDMYEEKLFIDRASSKQSGRHRMELPFASHRPSDSRSIFDSAAFEMPADIEESPQHPHARLSKVMRNSKKRRRQTSDDLVVDPINRQRPRLSRSLSFSDSELPCFQQSEPEKENVSAAGEPMDLSEEPMANPNKSAHSRKKDKAQPKLHEDMDIEMTRSSTDMTPAKSLSHPLSTRTQTKCSLGISSVLSPSKIMCSPFMGPVGWTVPPKLSFKKSKPFLIYQDPDFYDSARAYSSNYANLNAFVSDDEKENEPDLSDPMSPSFGSMEDDDLVMAQDNVLADAANIVTLANAFHSEGFLVSQSQDRFAMQTDDDKSDIGTPNNTAFLRRRQRTDPVMAMAAHSHLF